jgi:hypothetical protein
LSALDIVSRINYRAAQCFALARHNDWSRWFAISSSLPHLNSFQRILALDMVLRESIIEYNKLQRI